MLRQLAVIAAAAAAIVSTTAVVVQAWADSDDHGATLTVGLASEASAADPH